MGILRCSIRKAVVATAVAVATTVLAGGRQAHAIGPVTVEIAGELGGGTNPFSSPPNALGLGVGGRAGASFMGIYAGLRALYSFGGTKPAMLGSPAERNEHSWLYGVEVGYGLRFFDVLTIRPQVGIGNFALSDVAGGTTEVDANNIYLEPAMVVLLTLKPFLIGGDAGVLILPGFTGAQGGSPTTFTAFTAHGQLGVTF